MKKIPLARTGLTVSEYCLGTMTFGTQTDEADAHRQLDMALEAGVNFLDTAEMYPVNPISAETVGVTEEIVGRWLAARKPADMIVATKITGAGSAAIADGAPITPARMRAAVDASLTRLRAECLDIYQLHWPNRGSYHFRKHWTYDPRGQGRAEVEAHMLELLRCAQELVTAGKIRHLALSNESTWGTALWLRLAEEHDLPRVVSIQNEYSLLCRHFDTDLAELSVHEDVPLLAFSPLAAGLLTGKYAGGVIPEGSRRERNPELGGRITPRVFEAVSGYLGLAVRHGLDPVHLALAFTRSRPAVTIPILGATTSGQLEVALRGAGLELSAEVLEDIDRMHRIHPMPY
ncbi:aldo/keto reductase [Rhodobacteraceae bacterium 2376]|uniref:Aldo/keto reductase n=1 Tax=Rhabdonatronobacter sediminivivens TaxID=2743469 RepID=A0A7Z0KX96_9RHOB|nr:aldo/keto reductase [Rhabdonatronobacter sediminivivens]NYS24215.1 aldo/keto reductase [Rhabdonatronobacter sediminivivens]